MVEYSEDLLRAVYLDLLKYLREIWEILNSCLGLAHWMIQSCSNKGRQWLKTRVTSYIQSFATSSTEVFFFQSKGLSLPHRQSVRLTIKILKQ